MAGQQQQQQSVPMASLADPNWFSLRAVLLQYGLFVLIAAYLHYLQVPRLIQVLIESHEHQMGKSTSSFGHRSQQQQQQESFNHFAPMVTVPDPEADSFNDDAFMAQYQCNPDHKYRMSIVNHDPMLIMIEDFLAPGEAEHLKHLGMPGMARSTVASKTREIHESRTSFNAFLQRSQDKVVLCIEERASRLSQKPVENIEPLQVVWYRDGQEYLPHYDYFPDDSENYPNEVSMGGNRMITIFAYLNSVPEGHGGSTIFPRLDKKVEAKKNAAAFWYDEAVDGSMDNRTLHGGEKVFQSEKWGLKYVDISGNGCIGLMGS